MKFKLFLMLFNLFHLFSFKLTLKKNLKFNMLPKYSLTSSSSSSLSSLSSSLFTSSSSSCSFSTNSIPSLNLLHQSSSLLSSSSSSRLPSSTSSSLSLSTSSTSNHLLPLTLKEEEIELFNLLTLFIKEKNLNIILRVAGGWVRDKLLGLKGKNDIDIALNNITGSKFVELFTEWYTKKENKTLNYYVVELNPEKSKHLETASMKLNNYEIDFCGLRTENYTEDSRIPLIDFGTPREDAYRRDLTINSLFYNINTNEIEDFTGKGISDLIEGKISTPLPPLVTLQDDPLRCIRIVRFANRFNFSIVPEVIEACRDKSVHESLQRKVSRERIAQEIHQIMDHPSSSFHAIPLLYRLNLLEYILAIPTSNSLFRYFEKYPIYRWNWKYLLTPRATSIQEKYIVSEPVNRNDLTNSITSAWIYDDNYGPTSSLNTLDSLDSLNSCFQFNGYVDMNRLCQVSVCLNFLTYLLNQSNIMNSIPNLNLSEEIIHRNQKIQRYAALTYPCHEIYHSGNQQENSWTYLNQHGIKKGNFLPLAHYICSKSIMLGGKDADNVIKIHRGASLLIPILKNLILHLQQNINNHFQDNNECFLSLISLVDLGNISYQNWNVSLGNIYDRKVPKWSTLDRLSLGLLLREIGFSNFPVVLNLAYSELILEELFNHKKNENKDNFEKYNELIEELQIEVSKFNKNEIEEQNNSESKENIINLKELLRKYEKLNEIFLYGLNQLNLFDEFTKNPRFNGHDIKKFLPYIPRSLFAEVIHEQTQHSLCNPDCTFDEMKNHLQQNYPDYYKKQNTERIVENKSKNQEKLDDSSKV